MADAKISVDLEARLAKLDAGLRQAEDKVAKSTKKMDKMSKFDAFGGVVQKAMRAFAAFGILELGVKGANAAVNVMKGDFTEANELVKQLPLGIGPFAQGLEGIALTLMGINKQLKEMDAINKNLDEQLAKNKKIIDLVRSIREEYERSTYATREQLAILGATGMHKELLMLDQQGSAITKKANERIAMLEKEITNTNALARAIERVEATRDNELKVIKAKRDAVRGSVDDPHGGASQIGLRQAEAATERQLAAEVYALELELDGKLFAARRSRITAEFTERETKARTFAERDLLRSLRNIRMEKTEREESLAIDEKLKDFFDFEEPSGRRADFGAAEVSLANTSLEVRQQPVRNPQIDETNRKLASIENVNERMLALAQQNQGSSFA